VVRLEAGDVEGGFAGKARRTEREGLVSITLDLAHLGPVPLFHEVAHAWSYGGPATLDEGLAAVLADCMLRIAAIPLDAPPFPAHRGDLVGMVSLRDWDNAPTANPKDRELGYQAATGFFQALVSQVPLEELIPAQAWRSWQDFDAAAQDFPRGARSVLRVLDMSPAQQARQLSDRDGDGLVDLAETGLGFDPEQLDTDLDGRWDGLDPSRVPGTAQVLADPGWQCSGDRGTQARWSVGTPYVTRHDVTATTLGGSEGLVVRFDPTRFGADIMWVDPAPRAQTGSKRCRELDGLVVYTLDGRWGETLDEIIRVLLETETGPEVVQLGGDGASTAARWVLSDEVLAQAVAQGRFAGLAFSAQATGELGADDLVEEATIHIPGEASRFHFDGQPRCSGFHASPGSPVQWFGGDKRVWGEVSADPVTPDGGLVRVSLPGVERGWLMAQGPTVETSLRCLGVSGYTIYGPTDDHVGTIALLATRLERLPLSRRPTILLGQPTSQGDGDLVSLTDTEVQELLAAETSEPLRLRIEDLLAQGS
jgi:hypothetical protein